jgi:kynurenine formamidase
MKIYDLSQPLNQEVFFWPYYPPFETYYIKRKVEHGVNAQYIKTSNHMGTHLDAPRHFVTNGMTIDEIPLEWLCNSGVIVDLTAEMDDLAVYTPEMIESKVEVRDGDILILHTGWHRYAQFGEEADEERYVHMHPGPHPDMVPWLLEKNIRIWGVDVISTDHPMNLPIGRFLGKGMFGHCDRVRAKAEAVFGGPEHPHREHGGRDLGAGAPEPATDHRLLPLEVQRRRGGVRPHGGFRGELGRVRQGPLASAGRLAAGALGPTCPGGVPEAWRASPRGTVRGTDPEALDGTTAE